MRALRRHLCARESSRRLQMQTYVQVLRASKTYVRICSMRELVKVRNVAGSLVVSLPQSVLGPVGIQAGDRVVVEAAPPRRLIITKEGETMTSAQRLELEIDLLEKRKKALASDLKFKERQYNDSMPCDAGMEDNDVAILIMYGLVRDLDQLDVEVAEKRLELYDIQGGPAVNSGG